MAGAGLALLGKIPLKFNRELLDGAADVNLELHAQDPALIQALQDNKVPSPAQPLVIANADFNIEQGKTLTFASGSAKVGFSAGAGAKLAVISLPGQLRDGIVAGGDLAESIEAALNFNNGSAQPFLLLRLGYNIGATASGAVALGAAGSLTFSANAGRQGLYAIVRQPAVGEGFLESLQSLVGGVRLPKQVKSVDDLKPGTWIIAEADGSVGFSAGVKFGHDFSWIRETKLGTLTGDIGLKVAAGISANLGFSAAGKYAVLVSRESPNPADKILQLRIYKLRMKEFDFAFQAQATVTPVATVLPDQFDDFVRGVLGTHSTQVMDLLGKFDDWTKPESPIFGPLVGLADDEARKIIQKVTGVADLTAGFAKAKGIVQKLFETWHKLPAAAASRLTKFIEKSDIVNTVRDIVRKIASASDDDVKALITDRLNSVEFLQSPAGQFVESLALKGLFSVLNNNALLQDLKEKAQAAAAILDGGGIEASLTVLQGLVDQRLHISQIEDAVNSADLNKLDAWLRARLETFLEEKLVGADGVAKLKELRANLAKIRASFPEIYKKAIAALHRDYTFSLNATYKNTTTSEALLDLEFDFAAPGTQAAELLRVALQGRFDDVISRDVPGVKTRHAALTHGIRRETNVAVVFPFFSRTTTHINEALASLRTIDQSGGRLFFELQAQDLVEVKNQYSASLTISLQIEKSDVVVHSRDTATYLQSLDRAFQNESAKDLVQYAAPFVEPLFRGDFGVGGFNAWVGETFGANAQLGKSLLALDVTLPPQACLAWLKAPSDKKSTMYQDLSIRLQRKFKQLIHDAFFQRVEQYETVATGSDAFSVMVFASIPPCTKAKLDGTTLTITTQDSDGSVYWNQPDFMLRRAMADASRVKGNLQERMALARTRLQAAGDPHDRIGFYKDSQAEKIVASAQDDPTLISLLFVESIMVNKVVEAALEIAKFRDNQMSDPAKARKALAEFGLEVTNAFQAKLKTVAVGDALLPLGSLMFMEAAQTLDPSLQGAISAMLSIIDVKDTIPFPPLNFPNNEPIAAADIVRTETLVHTA